MDDEIINLNVFFLILGNMFQVLFPFLYLLLGNDPFSLLSVTVLLDGQDRRAVRGTAR